MTSRSITLRAPSDSERASRTKRRDRSDTLARWLEADDLSGLLALVHTDFQRAHQVSRLLIVSHVNGQRQRLALSPDEDEGLRRQVEQWFSGGDNPLFRIVRDNPDAPDERLEDLVSFRAPLRNAGFTACAGIETTHATRYVVLWSTGFESDDPENEDLDLAVRQGPLWRHLITALGNMARMEDLRDLSHTDSVTGVFNRRHFDVRLAEEAARARRFGRPLSLLILDLDDFKQVNDTHGHLAGDRVLKQVAAFIRRSVRSIDVFCRLGGDEFAVLMPDTGAEECAGLATRLCQAIAAKRFRTVRKVTDLSLSISIGGVLFPDHTNREDRLVRFADSALMVAKRGGRNCYVQYEPDPSDEHDGEPDSSRFEHERQGAADAVLPTA